MTTNQTENTVSRIAKVIGWLSAISIPVLYLIGYLFHMGNLHMYGLPIENFPQSIEQYLVNSFFAIVSQYMKLLALTNNIQLLVGFAIFLFLFWFLMVLDYRFNEKFAGNISRLKGKVRGYKHFDLAFIPPILTTVLFGALAVLISIPTLGILMVLSGYESGKEMAIRDMRSFVSCSLADSSCSTVVLDGKSFEGLIVAMSEKYLAIYDGTSTHVIPTDRLMITTKPVQREKGN
jgi:hypothetical protein